MLDAFFLWRWGKIYKTDNDLLLEHFTVQILKQACNIIPRIQNIKRFCPPDAQSQNYENHHLLNYVYLLCFDVIIRISVQQQKMLQKKTFFGEKVQAQVGIICQKVFFFGFHQATRYIFDIVLSFYIILIIVKPTYHHQFYDQ